MATNSIFHNIVINSKEAAEKFINALEQAEKWNIEHTNEIIQEEGGLGKKGICTDEAMSCPFCGSKGEDIFFQEERYPDDNEVWYRPKCDCGVVLEARESIDEAIVLWNTRVNKECHEDICGTTKLHCIKCSPGPCGSRI